MSVTVSTPGQVSDLLANPDALNTAFDQKVQQDPAGTTKALSDFMNDPATRQSMVQEAQDNLQAIHETQLAFGRIYSLLAQIDAQNFKGPDGKVIGKLAPTWRGYSDTFNQSLSQTETLASQGKALIDTFTKSILPILQSTTMTLADKKARLAFYANSIDQNDHTVTAIDALLHAYGELENNVASFKGYFEATIEKPYIDIQRVKEDIEILKTKLAQYEESAKKLGISADIAAGVGAGLLATGVLAPFAYASFAASLVPGIKEVDEYFNKVQQIQHELADRKNDLAALESQPNAIQKPSPVVTAAASEMDHMCLTTEKLQILAQIFKLVKNDIVDASFQLNTADSADLTDIRTEQLSLAATSYASLAIILEMFATGWSTQVTPPSS
ncbi:hypothetical protein B0H11DRAFT_2275172 [Mycena galericulata]|nr:hypothetical protein B0H11DRAFT_2275172 [Mycena galericulata]